MVETMRSKYLIIVFICSFFINSLHAQLSLENAFPNLSFSSPVFLTNAGDGSDRIFIVEQAGKIKVFQNSSSAQVSKTFLDITDRVTSGGETGLLGLAFHPDFKNNGYFYVDYTTPNPLTTRISRFRVSSNPDSADKNSEVVLLSFTQPYSNHNGGWIGFGPNDGYLYIGTGDGGSGGDPQNNAQNITKYLGKILRINVDSQNADLNYAIPPDNPFIDSTESVLKEIYAWGLRNPWRDSFDPVTRWLWCADVGQGSWEEINIIQKGKNYGWRCYEGNHEYNTDLCNYPEYVFPIWEYNHFSGRCSITGGYVYHGQNVPELKGKFIYADYCASTIWALTYNGSKPATNQTLSTAPASIVSFGVDENQELYIVTQNPSSISKFTPTTTLAAPTNLVATASGPNEVILSWDDNSTIEDGFKVERKTDETGSYSLQDSVGQNVTIYNDQSVQRNTLYYYRVYAYTHQTVSEYSNQDSAQTPNITGVNDQSIPLSYNLEQNFPNPFNPSTTIKFSLPEQSKVDIVVYNLLGMQIDTIAKGVLQSGYFEKIWNAKNAASGIYYVKMIAKSVASGKIYIKTIKMILIK